MESNIGGIDKIIRIIVAISIFILYFSNQISGNIAVVLMALASILILTSSISFCPLYFLFGFSTRPKEQ